MENSLTVEKRKINTPVLVASILTSMAFVIHTIGGDMELQLIQPSEGIPDWNKEQQIWTMVRCGWHWISFDLLFASVGLILITFTNVIVHKKTVLNILWFYFFGYAIQWVIVLIISKQFPDNYLKLCQWILLLSISGLIYWGSRKVDPRD